MSRTSRRKAKQQAAPTPSDPPKKPPKKPSLSLNKGGCKTVLTPELQREAVEAARLGLPLTFVGPRVGVTKTTIFNWLRWGRKADNEPYSSFLAAINEARAKFVETSLTAIADHGKDSWQAKAWLLERMFRDEFGGDKLELNQLKKELRELRQLFDKVPRVSGEEAPETDGGTAGRADQSHEPPADQQDAETV